MKRTWTAERDVTPELAQELVTELCPDLAGTRPAPLGVGWDNTAYAFGDWVFRFPRREIAVPLLRTECVVLPAIAARLPLPIPVPERVGAPTERFPWPFAGYPWLPGRTACTADLDEGQRALAAEPLARFLSALHAIPAARARALGAPLDELRRLDLELRTNRILERLAEARTAGLIRDEDEAVRALLADVPDGWTPGTTCLVHGDLYARHVLVDDDGHPCGVIDWGDVHAGDPAVDLSLAHGFLPPAARAAFRAAYGPIDDEAWRVARLRALHSALVVLVYAHDVGDADLLREARTSLRYVLA